MAAKGAHWESFIFWDIDDDQASLAGLWGNDVIRAE